MPPPPPKPQTPDPSPPQRPGRRTPTHAASGGEARALQPCTSLHCTQRHLHLNDLTRWKRCFLLLLLLFSFSALLLSVQPLGQSSVSSEPKSTAISGFFFFFFYFVSDINGCVWRREKPLERRRGRAVLPQREPSDLSHPCVEPQKAEDGFGDFGFHRPGGSGLC